MTNELLKIYQDQIILEPKVLSDDYYYFYDENGQIFGISKKISNNEYQLLKSFYLEKDSLVQNDTQNKIHNYIYQNGQYPFDDAVKFIVLENKDMPIIETELCNLLFKTTKVMVDKYCLIFYQDDNENIQEMFNTLTDDLGIVINVHEGININQKVNGELLAHYIYVLNQANCFNKAYSNLTNLVFETSSTKIYPLLKDLQNYIVEPLLNKKDNYTLLQTYFKNDLNVSKTAKDLYLNRNSIINKLDTISKTLGFNIQSFKFSALLLMLMSLK